MSLVKHVGGLQSVRTCGTLRVEHFSGFEFFSVAPRRHPRLVVEPVETRPPAMLRERKPLGRNLLLNGENQ